MLTIGLEMTKDEVVHLYNALLVNKGVDFMRAKTFLKYPACLHSVSMTNFSSVYITYSGYLT